MTECYRNHVVLGVVGMLLMSGCCTSPEKPMEVDEAINAWLMCDECIDGEFETVTDYCEKHVARRLAAIAANGPSPEVMQQYEARLRTRYKARQEYAADRGLEGPAINEDEYVEIHTRALVDRFQARAIKALVEVSPAAAVGAMISEAQQSLESARQDELDDL